jgi:hypothetical protein
MSTGPRFVCETQQNKCVQALGFVLRQNRAPRLRLTGANDSQAALTPRVNGGVQTTP